MRRFFWWGMVDLNHRRHCQQIYSLSPLATREIPQIQYANLNTGGAGGRTSNPDLLITNQLLYQLSYHQHDTGSNIIANSAGFVNKNFNYFILCLFFAISGRKRMKISELSAEYRDSAMLCRAE